MSSDESFVWTKERFLTWSNFQGTPDKTAPSWQHAISATKLVQITNFDPVQKSTKIKLKINWVKIESNFVPKKSWLKKGSGSKDLLKHEQGHFDLAELISRELTEKLNRKLKESLISTSYMTLDEADKDPQGLITKRVSKEFEIYKKTTKFTHEKYDKETEHGKIDYAQRQYDERFAQLRI